MHQIGEGGGDKMRHMADGCSHVIMLLVAKDQGQCTHFFYEGVVFCNSLLCDSLSRRENIIGVFQQNGTGVCKPCFLAARHGMPADKMTVKAKLCDSFMDRALDAAHIRDNGIFGQYRF